VYYLQQSTTSITIFDAGQYSLSVTNVCGTYVDSLHLVVHENVFSFPFDSLWLQTGQTITIDAGSGYSSYNWSTGDTTQSIIVGNYGMYWVTVSDSLGCLGSDVVEVVKLDGSSTLDQLNNIIVYPNPFKEELVIDGLIDQNTKITLWNSIGQSVFTKVTQTLTRNAGYGKMKLNMSIFPNGIYLLIIQKEKQRKVFKVVKE
jgi:hypothetical protein